MNALPTVCATFQYVIKREEQNQIPRTPSTDTWIHNSPLFSKDWQRMEAG